MYGHYKLTPIHCNSQNSNIIYTVQYDDKKIVSGHADQTIKVCIIELVSENKGV